MHVYGHIVSGTLPASVMIFFQGDRTAFEFAIIWLWFVAAFTYVGLDQAADGRSKRKSTMEDSFVD